MTLMRTAPYPARRGDPQAHIGRHFNSFRDYVEALKGIGEIQEIDQPVDWNLEMGAIIRHSTETKAAAPLFNNVIGADDARLGALDGHDRRASQTRSPAAVTAVAGRWGFVHLGRFTQQYRQLFGEAPSQTLRSSNR
jgi:3-polyprenyl-4-hydroxybenzoate decarboxylase